MARTTTDWDFRCTQFHSILSGNLPTINFEFSCCLKSVFWTILLYIMSLNHLPSKTTFPELNNHNANPPGSSPSPTCRSLKVGKDIEALSQLVSCDMMFVVLRKKSFQVDYLVE